MRRRVKQHSGVELEWEIKRIGVDETADMSEPILIAGGGLGGLTAALALARRGWQVRVLEGASDFGAIGYGIQFGPNVFHVLDQIGVSEAVLQQADCPPAALMLDAFTGDEVTRVPTAASFRRRFKFPYIIIHRTDLHLALLEACRDSARSSSCPTPWCRDLPSMTAW